MPVRRSLEGRRSLLSVALGYEKVVQKEREYAAGQERRRIRIDDDELLSQLVIMQEPGGIQPVGTKPENAWPTRHAAVRSGKQDFTMRRHEKSPPNDPN
jgi:hypothetical protein